MGSPNTHRRRAGFLLTAALMVVMVSIVEVTADSSNSPCIRPMNVNCADRKSKLADKIIGGNIAEPGSTPWLVSLQDTSFPETVPFCGGTLLSHSWVLTSASCVFSYQGNYGSIQVVLGEYDMEEMDGYERYRPVSQILLHPDYDAFNFHADVALIRLGMYVFYNERVGILKLPTWSDEPRRCDNDDDDDEKHDNNGCDGDYDDALYTIAGWGVLVESGDPSPVVRMAKVPLVDREVCRSIYPDIYTSTLLCAGNLTDGGVDSCQGDWGGALASSDGYIMGVSTRSVGCGQIGYPGMYTDVTQQEERRHPSHHRRPPQLPSGRSVHLRKRLIRALHRPCSSPGHGGTDLGADEPRLRTPVWKERKKNRTQEYRTARCARWGVYCRGYSAWNG